MTKEHLKRELEAWMAEQGIPSFAALARGLYEAGYRPGKGGNFSRQKLSNWIHRNEGVPDSFFYAMDQVIGLQGDWPMRLARARMADALRRPMPEEEGGEAHPSSYEEETERLYSYGFALAYDAEDADPNPKDHDPRGEIWRYGPTGDLFTRADALRYIETNLEERTA